MQTVSVDGVPIAPSKIVCIGRNYVAHIEELGNAIPQEMVVFNKPNSAIADTLLAEIDGETLHYEGELCFVVREGSLAAVGFGLDLTRRELQARLKQQGLPWERAKAFDGAALFSAFVPLREPVESLSLELVVDGQRRQAGAVGLMLYPPPVILRELRGFMTLEDGDILMTGTPGGVGPVRRGERFEGRVLVGGRTLAGAAWVAR